MCIPIPLEAWLLKASPTDIREVVVRVCVRFHQKLRTYEVVSANDA